MTMKPRRDFRSQKTATSTPLHRPWLSALVHAMRFPGAPVPLLPRALGELPSSRHVQHPAERVLCTQKEGMLPTATVVNNKV